jgi:hypothetical protein
MIPQVRTWKVTYYFSDEDPKQVFVDTINKRFAKWAARDIVGYLCSWNATKVTVSLAGVQKT